MTRQTRQSDPANKLLFSCEGYPLALPRSGLFSHPRVAADLIRLIGDDWVDDLDLDRLEQLRTEYVSADLRTRRADLPWWAPFKSGTGQPDGAGVLFHIEFQSSPDPHMAERLMGYIALLRQDLRRSKWMAAGDGRIVAHVPLVVYNGRAKWNVPLQLGDHGWMPEELRALQPHLAGLLVDAKDYAGDDAADGNLARTALALDAASAPGLTPALQRAAALYSAADDEEADDQELWLSFRAWCDGILGPRFGGQLRTLLDNKETTMLAETLQEWDEQKINEGRRAGRREGRQEVLGEERALLCSQASLRFGEATSTELATILAGVEDASELARVGTLIIGCESGSDFLARARR